MNTNGHWLETSRGDFLFINNSDGSHKFFGCVIPINGKWKAEYHPDGKPLRFLMCLTRTAARAKVQQETGVFEAK